MDKLKEVSKQIQVLENFVDMVTEDHYLPVKEERVALENLKDFIKDLKYDQDHKS